MVAKNRLLILSTTHDLMAAAAAPVAAVEEEGQEPLTMVVEVGEGLSPEEGCYLVAFVVVFQLEPLVVVVDVVVGQNVGIPSS